MTRRKKKMAKNNKKEKTEKKYKTKPLKNFVLNEI